MAKDKKEGGIKSISEALDRLEKKYGEGTVMKLAKGAVVINAPVHKTGIYSIDRTLGGGFAKGRMVELYGNEGSGKTTLALQAIIEAQQEGKKKCAFIDVEHAIDLKYAKSLGVNLEELYFSQPDSAEEAMDIAKTLAQTGQFAIVVIDSVAALSPLSELEGEVGKATMGSLARFLSTALKQILSEFSKSDCTLILINQLREKIGIAYGNPEYTTGGRALKYYASQRIALRRSTKIEDKEGNNIGYLTMVKVEKNKIALPHQKTQVPFINGKGFDKIADIFMIGVRVGLITKDKATYYFDKEKIGVGESASKAALAGNLEMQKALLKRLDSQVPAEIGEQDDSDDGFVEDK